jgi:hypothetical protein
MVYFTIEFDLAIRELPKRRLRSCFGALLAAPICMA